MDPILGLTDSPGVHGPNGPKLPGVQVQAIGEKQREWGQKRCEKPGNFPTNKTHTFWRTFRMIWLRTNIWVLPFSVVVFV